MFYFGFYPTSKGKIWRWVGMRIEGKEIGKETIAKVEDENDKDLNSPWSNGDVVGKVNFRKKQQSP